MKDHVHAAKQRFEPVTIEHVHHMELDCGVAVVLRQVLARADGQVVHDDDVIATQDECVDQVTADESRTAGHEHSSSIQRHRQSSSGPNTRASLPAAIVTGAHPAHM
jgi:hypothetical protein